MIDTRLPLALEGGLVWPESGRAAVFYPPLNAGLSDMDRTNCDVIVDSKPEFDAWETRGFAVKVAPDAEYAAAIVCLPRAKAQARAVLEQASRVTTGPLVVDGQKTDGIDSILKSVRTRAAVDGVISKSHGKLFWINGIGPDALADWAQGPALTEGGFWTAPGVFSADGIDPASALLADALPASLGARVADLGAGWGFLSAHVLTRPDVKVAHLVEAGHMALECARRNVTDPRAVFHWADATQWKLPEPVDSVVMNPPFHTGRAAEPALGQAFIATASRILTGRGSLWLVANRHLPYEAALTVAFGHVEEVAGDNRFKVLLATRPARKRR